MSTDQLFLGIDSGTQGTKVIVFSTKQKKVISEGYASHNLIENGEGKKNRNLPGRSRYLPRRSQKHWRESVFQKM